LIAKCQILVLLLLLQDKANEQVRWQTWNLRIWIKKIKFSSLFSSEGKKIWMNEWENVRGEMLKWKRRVA
jgi:hypothetical protein